MQQTAALTDAVLAAQRELRGLTSGDVTDRKVKKAAGKVASFDADLAGIQNTATETVESRRGIQAIRRRG